MINSILSILYTVKTARNPQSLLTVLFMETQLMPIQRADVATAPWLRSAQCLPPSYHPFFLFLLLSSVSVPYASICFLRRRQPLAATKLILFRAIVLSNGLWRHGEARHFLIPYPCPFSALIPSLTERSQSPGHRENDICIRERHFHDVFCWGGNLLSLHENMVQETLKLNFNFLLSIFKCMLHDKPPCD